MSLTTRFRLSCKRSGKRRAGMRLAIGLKPVNPKKSKQSKNSKQSKQNKGGQLPVSIPFGLPGTFSGLLPPALAAFVPPPPPAPSSVRASAPVVPAPPPCVEPALGFIGLKNTGKTCFFNAPVQCLMHIDALHDYFERDWPQTEGAASRGPKSIARCYYELQGAMDAIPRDGYVEPTGFLTAINHKFPIVRQHDAVELLDFLLDALHDEILETQPGTIGDGWRLQDPRNPCAAELMQLPPPATTIISRLFSFELCITETCNQSDCHRVSHEPSPRQVILELPFCPEEGDKFSLEGCLHHLSYTQDPHPGACKHCHGTGKCTRTYMLSRLPRFLILRVPVGRNADDLFQGEFDFPEKLDVTEHVRTMGPTAEAHARVICQVKAVIRHLGTNEKGHFISWIRIGSKWYLFDDTKVYESTLQASTRGITDSESRVSLLVYECPDLSVV